MEDRAGRAVAPRNADGALLLFGFCSVFYLLLCPLQMKVGNASTVEGQAAIIGGGFEGAVAGKEQAFTLCSLTAESNSKSVRAPSSRSYAFHPREYFVI